MATTKIVRSPDRLNVESGGEIEVDSGGTLTVESGGSLVLDSGHTLTINGSAVSLGTGITAGSMTTVSEAGAIVRESTITLSSDTVAMTDATTNGCHGSLLIGTFPVGGVSVLGCRGTFSSIEAGAGGVGDAASLVISVGSATVGTDNATLTTTEANILPSTAATLSSGKNTTVDAATTAGCFLNGASSAAKIYLNFAVPDADSSGNDTITVSGTVKLQWLGL